MERDAQAFGRADAEVALGTSLDVDCFPSSPCLEQEYLRQSSVVSSVEIFEFFSCIYVQILQLYPASTLSIAFSFRHIICI